MKTYTNKSEIRKLIYNYGNKFIYLFGSIMKVDFLYKSSQIFYIPSSS